MQSLSMSSILFRHYNKKYTSTKRVPIPVLLKVLSVDIVITFQCSASDYDWTRQHYSSIFLIWGLQIIYISACNPMRNFCFFSRRTRLYQAVVDKVKPKVRFKKSLENQRLTRNRPALNLSTLVAGILIMVQQVRLMMFSSVRVLGKIVNFDQIPNIFGI